MPRKAARATPPKTAPKPWERPNGFAVMTAVQRWDARDHAKNATVVELRRQVRKLFARMTPHRSVKFFDVSDGVAIYRRDTKIAEFTIRVPDAVTHYSSEWAIKLYVDGQNTYLYPEHRIRCHFATADRIGIDSTIVEKVLAWDCVVTESIARDAEIEQIKAATEKKIQGVLRRSGFKHEYGDHYVSPHELIRSITARPHGDGTVSLEVVFGAVAAKQLHRLAGLLKSMCAASPVE